MSRPRARNWLLVITLAATAFACDPVWVLKGLILDGVPVEGKKASKPDPRRPLSGAKVSVRCAPDGWSRDVAVAPDGTFSAQGLGYLPSNCSVFLSREGYVSKTVSVSAVCEHTALLQRGLCQVMNIETQLQPAIDDAKQKIATPAKPDGGDLPDGGSNL